MNMEKRIIKYLILSSIFIFLGLSTAQANTTNDDLILHGIKLIALSKTTSHANAIAEPSPSIPEPSVPAPGDEPCVYATVYCPNGVAFMAIICDEEDFRNYLSIYCGICSD